MFLLQYTILACLLTAVHSFATKDIESNRKQQKSTASVFTTFAQSCCEKSSRMLVSKKKLQLPRVISTGSLQIHRQSLQTWKMQTYATSLGLDDLNDDLQIRRQGLAINEKVYGKKHLLLLRVTTILGWGSNEGHGR